MSAGPRIPLAMAEDAAAYLLRTWGVQDATVVGSVRRRRPEVGDLEIACPWSAAPDDELYRTLHASAGETGGLFATPSDLPPVTARRGLAPAFLECDLVVHLTVDRSAGGQPLDLPVQICRYQPGQRAWRVIMRTGPRDFGRWFLGRWKRAYGIDHSRPASVDGYLVDASGRVVAIDDEAEAFRRCRVAYLPPEKRDAFVADLEARGAWHG